MFPSRRALRFGAPLLIAAAALAGPLACRRTAGGPYFSATSQTPITPGGNFTQAKLAAIRAAERMARDQILRQALARTFPGGTTMEDAAIADPFLRAKVYDAIRTAVISDQTLDDNNVVTVTVRMDMAPVLKILADPANEPKRPPEETP